MKVGDLFASVWLSLSRHRVRSLMAMAGVAVGVCALTSIASVEQSWRKAVTDFFAPMDLETVRVEIPAHRNWRERGFSKPALGSEDVEAILASCPAAESATLVEQGRHLAESEQSALVVTLRAVAADFTQTLPDEIREGRLFTEEEAARMAPVCVLSSLASYRLFRRAPAVGEDLLVGYRPFRVVGVIAGNRHGGIGIGSEAIYLPASWARKLLGSKYGFSRRAEIYVHTEDPKQAVSQIEELMRHRVGGDETRPFAHSLWQVREAALNARTRATLYSGLAGLCALLAAGVGITALLFVSVAERSREIGIHRALGASRSRIYGEHIVAAAMLAAGGAVLGVLAGIPAAAAAAFAARWEPVLDSIALNTLAEQGLSLDRLSTLGPVISWEAAALACALALLTGVAAALAPASEAAAIDPALAIAHRAGTRTRLRKLLTATQVAFGVLVLVVLTSYFSVLQRAERAEAREMLGQDTLSATADPIAALKKPVDPDYVAACEDALAEAVSSSERMAVLRQHTPLLTSPCPYVTGHGPASWAGRTVEQVRLVYTTAETFDYEPKLGAEDTERAARAFREDRSAVVINPRIKERLFPDRSAVGESLTIAGKKFTVVGVRPYPRGAMLPPEAWLPISFYSTMKHRMASKPGRQSSGEPRAGLQARPLDVQHYAEAGMQLRDALLPMLPEEYRKGIAFSEEIPETTKQFVFQHRAVATRGAAGALAVLLVALIGLANMLLVSVHEEMREIGVRRALGAQRPDIFLHFLSRGVLLSAVGAAAGLGIGALICWGSRTWAGLPISVSIFWAAAGAVATVLAGAAVSLIPAFIGARVHPVEALRYE